MGGTVNVVVRKRDGSVHKMAKWTNSLKYHMLDKDFLNEGKSLDEYISRAEELKQDYRKNKDTKNFANETAPWYGPYETIAPISYGLVVFDFMENKVMSMQGYTSMKKESTILEFSDLMALMSAMGKESFDSDVEDVLKKHPEHDITRIYNLYNDGIFSGLEHSDYHEGEYVGWCVEPTEGKTFADVVDHHIKTSKIAKESGSLISEGVTSMIINIDRFEFIDFNESRKGCLEFKAKLIELGFEISDSEMKEWDEFISDYHPDEDD